MDTVFVGIGMHSLLLPTFSQQHHRFTADFGQGNWIGYTHTPKQIYVYMYDVYINIHIEVEEKN